MKIDEPTAVRSGEELRVETLQQYLLEELPAAHGPLRVSQFPRGYSNLTYLLELGNQEFVLRRPPMGNQVASAHDMSREYLVLSQLSDAYPAAPKPLLMCRDPAVIGAEFYVMERRRGLILRSSQPTELDGASPTVLRALSESFVDQLVSLHELDVRAIGLDQLQRDGDYVERQVAGWARRYEAARTGDNAAMDRVAQWLADHRPASRPSTLIHNDYKIDNLVLDPHRPERIVAVLDWEMATVGDPLMDLGSALAYWIEATDPEPLRTMAFGPTMRSGSMTRGEIVDRYLAATGTEPVDFRFYYCYGLFKLAVIVQQIYSRFVRGHTSDTRFAHLDQMVAVLARTAEALLGRDATT